MGRKKVIREEWTQAEKFELCLKEAEQLEGADFIPPLDNMEENTIAEVISMVESEKDIAAEGHTDAPKRKVEQAKRFIERWTPYIEQQEKNEPADVEQVEADNSNQTVTATKRPAGQKTVYTITTPDGQKIEKRSNRDDVTHVSVCWKNPVEGNKSEGWTVSLHKRADLAEKYVEENNDGMLFTCYHTGEKVKWFENFHITAVTEQPQETTITEPAEQDNITIEKDGQTWLVRDNETLVYAIEKKVFPQEQIFIKTAKGNETVKECDTINEAKKEVKRIITEQKQPADIDNSQQETTDNSTPSETAEETTEQPAEEREVHTRKQLEGTDKGNQVNHILKCLPYVEWENLIMINTGKDKTEPMIIHCKGYTIIFSTQFNQAKMYDKSTGKCINEAYINFPPIYLNKIAQA